MDPGEDAGPQSCEMSCSGHRAQQEPTPGQSHPGVSHAHTCVHRSDSMRGAESAATVPRKRGTCGSSWLPFLEGHTDPPCSAEPSGQPCGYRPWKCKHWANQ